jgi:hypothetical protein
MNEPAVPVLLSACNFMSLVQVAERKKNPSSWVYRNEDAEFVGSNPAVTNHHFFCEESKTPHNQDVIKLYQPEIQLILRG